MIGGAATQRQRSRLAYARSLGAHLVQISARHGYARFRSVGDAEVFAAWLVADSHCDVSVYDMCSQVAVDWSDEPREGNGNVQR